MSIGGHQSAAAGKAGTMTKSKIMAICTHCKSTDVVADAYASWNVKTQDWEVANTFDKGAYCNDCDGETRIDWIEHVAA